MGAVSVCGARCNRRRGWRNVAEENAGRLTSHPGSRCCRAVVQVGSNGSAAAEGPDRGLVAGDVRGSRGAS